MKVYLDNSATTRPDDSVIQAMNAALSEDYYNPSALYAPAIMVEKKMTACRSKIEHELNSKGRVVFTSGGTEADNLAILGTMRYVNKSPGRVLYSAGEHPAVIESCKVLAASGFDVREIPLNQEGFINLADFEKLLTHDTQLICVMHINNETGAIQPLSRVSALREQFSPQALLHVDGVQGFLRQQCDVSALNIDSYALSAHKIHGPKGVGALWLSDKVKLDPIIHGGGQEYGLRSGTENTAGIAGLHQAIAIYPKTHSMRTLKFQLYHRLLDAIPSLSVNGPEPGSAESSDHILNLSLPPVKAETMLHALEAMDVYVGNGSACSSKKRQASHVLKAMNLSGSKLDSAIRFSLNPYINDLEIDYAADCVIKNYRVLRHFVRR